MIRTDRLIRVETDGFLLPDKIARQGLLILRDRITQPLNADLFSRFAPQLPGNVVNVFKGRSAEDVIPVTLDTIGDVNFSVTAADLRQPLADFSAKFLAPACMVLAEQIDTHILAAGPGAQFVCAPQVLHDGMFGENETMDGLSLRVVYQFELSTLEFTVSTDILFGVHPAVPEMKVA
ncbi:hypothetical protein ACIP5Y_21580 [Nocardia sp. NPDC088792]|uniref:hypothetical protein n=1 Tax=Nocardia sp. NPDC088792 TaxID=3364332 RepID=UPI00381AE1C7